MVIIESYEFAQKVETFLQDEEYGELQWYLVRHPESGDLIRGGGGLRKLRWASQSKGKRGGYRIIYFFHMADDTILMVDMYKKNQQEDLSQGQLSYLKGLVKEFQKQQGNQS